MVSKGTKFRPSVQDSLSDMAPGTEINEYVYKDLTRALNAFRKNIGSSIGGNAENELKVWADEVLNEVKRRNDLHGPTLTTPPVDLDSTLQPEDRDTLTELHKRYAITTADKADGNFVVMCKKHYIRLTIEELNSSLAYTRVADGTTLEV
jgi:hypothetical protein